MPGKSSADILAKVRLRYEQRRSPPPKLTPLSLFPAFPFSSPKHLDTVCFCRFICFSFFVVWTSPGLDISFRVTVKNSHWNGCAAREYILLFSACLFIDGSFV
ncbi:hypothetical protein N7537_001882 [Penicillium hordei]|uniref:Uncharacterized protein n=1 Tax=Penicillium hordei TaxID=40994 RepID=A0AAD6H7C1_9EURO|nr:uncharacterized protein N7537_001882 [Penicillium hordei]KAJ5616768.1 hypothetical protein N7537_001882 [Penicillium hordei]